MQLLRSFLGIAILAALAPSALAAPASNKPYQATISPSTASAGSETAFVITLKNPTYAQQQLGAAEITVPAGWGITAAELTAGGSGTMTRPSSNVIQLNYLALQPGDQQTLSVTANVPCSASGSVQWGVRAKQANEFNGTGNLLHLENPVTTTISGACRLEFATQPANARVGEAITGTAYTPTAQPPVRVEVVDGSGARVTSSTVSITLAKNTGPAPLAGTRTVSASAGLASFSNVNLGTPGAYTLIATSSGLTSAVSSGFRVDTAAEVCFEDVTCTTTVTTTRTRVGVSAFPSGSALDSGFLTASMNAGPMIDCDGYQEVSPDIALVDMTSLSRTKTATLTIDKKQMAIVPNNGAAFLQFCFGSPVPFVTADGVLSLQDGTFDWDSDGDTEPVYIGLLPNCSGATPPPCVASRNKTGAGDGVIQAKLPAGDPAMRG